MLDHAWAGDDTPHATAKRRGPGGLEPERRGLSGRLGPLRQVAGRKRVQDYYSDHVMGRIGRLPQRPPTPERYFPQIRRPDPDVSGGETVRPSSSRVESQLQSRNAPKDFVEKLRREHRIQVTVDGKPLLIAGKPANWLCPSNPVNRQFEMDCMLEVARKYSVAHAWQILRSVRWNGQAGDWRH